MFQEDSFLFNPKSTPLPLKLNFTKKQKNYQYPIQQNRHILKIKLKLHESLGKMPELVVFLHGMWGSEFDFKNFAEAVKARAEDKVVTLRIKGNRNRTYKGVENGARTAFAEVQACIAENSGKGLDRLSIIGHSVSRRFLDRLFSIRSKNCSIN